MKKIFSTIMTLALAAFVFTSCEDVPAPYNLPGEGGSEEGGTESGVLPYNTTNLKEWTNFTVKGNAWDLGSTYAKATGYNSSDKTYTETEAWLVSPYVNLATTEGAYIKMEHVNRYGSDTSNPNNHQIFISSDYTGDINSATWTKINYSAKETTTKDWTFYDSEEMQIPEEFIGKNIVVAFKYTCGSSNATTWEIKNFTISEGKASGSGEESTPSGDVIEKSCSEAAAIALAMNDGGVTTEVYSITGYITDVFKNISNNQQSFWMADTKDGGKVFEAFYANLPEGVSEFTLGSKVKITGNITRYKDTPEMKNPTVEILEAGTPVEPDPTPDPDPTPAGDPDLSLVMKNIYSDCTTNVDAGTKTVGDFTMSYAIGDGTSAPKYYFNATDKYCSVRMYAKNTAKFESTKKIAKLVITCAEGSGSTVYNGNSTMTTSSGTITKASDKVTITIDGINSNSVNVVNDYSEAKGGTQLRIVKLDIYYVK